jgi:6-phosphogluconolactonase
VTRCPTPFVFPSEAETARAMARWLHEQLAGVADTGRNMRLALSGGKTPWTMLRDFVDLEPPWERLDIFQVDERFVPIEDPQSNAGQIARILPPEARFWPVPVDLRATPEDVAREYENILIRVIGNPPEFDVVHLGLGEDGHTASLVPGDPILHVDDRWVAATAEPYRGTRRISFTYPTLGRARRIAWLVTGSAKREILQEFLTEDPSLPACRVPRAYACLFADVDAWGKTSLGAARPA